MCIRKVLKHQVHIVLVIVLVREVILKGLNAEQFQLRDIFLGITQD